MKQYEGLVISGEMYLVLIKLTTDMNNSVSSKE